MSLVVLPDGSLPVSAHLNIFAGAFNEAIFFLSLSLSPAQFLHLILYLPFINTFMYLYIFFLS